MPCTGTTWILAGHYTQRAAYCFYAVMGTGIPIGPFFPGRGVTPWLIAWAIGVAVIVPWSLWSIVKIRQETLPDMLLPDDDVSTQET